MTSTTGGVAGLLTQEAAPGGTVTYTFMASSPGTRAYYSGTQGDLQIEMGLYGAIIVLPATIPAACTARASRFEPELRETHWGESDFRLAAAAYDHAKTCYDREYMFQFSEMDPRIHSQALAQVTAKAGCTAGAPGCSLEVPTEPYHPAYFHDQWTVHAGRHGSQLRDSSIRTSHTTEILICIPANRYLLRIIGQGRWQHPFHEHGNHVRILARDGNLILSQNRPDTNPRRTAALHHDDNSWTGDGRDLLLDRQRPELGRVRSQSRFHRSQCHATVHSGRQRVQHRRSDGDQLLRVVPGP